MEERRKLDPILLAKLKEVLGNSQDEVPVFPGLFDLFTLENIVKEMEKDTPLSRQFLRTFLETHKITLETQKIDGVDHLKEGSD